MWPCVKIFLPYFLKMYYGVEINFGSTNILPIALHQTTKNMQKANGVARKSNSCIIFFKLKANCQFLCMSRKIAYYFTVQKEERYFVIYSKLLLLKR